MVMIDGNFKPDSLSQGNGFGAANNPPQAQQQNQPKPQLGAANLGVVTQASPNSSPMKANNQAFGQAQPQAQVNKTMNLQANQLGQQNQNHNAGAPGNGLNGFNVAGMGGMNPSRQQQPQLKFNPQMANLKMNGNQPQGAPKIGNFNGAPGFNQGFNSNFQGPNFQGFQGQNTPVQMPQRQLSSMQSVNNDSPQSVQNFLTALNKVGAGGNNAMFNAAGEQGVGPVAGFQGFQSNGFNAGPQQQLYSGPMASQIGYGPTSGLGSINNGAYAQGGPNWAQTIAGKGNSSFMGGPAQLGGLQQGGTGGVAGQPIFEEPDPWANKNEIANTDEARAAWYSNEGKDPNQLWDDLTGPGKMDGAYYAQGGEGTPGTVTGVVDKGVPHAPPVTSDERAKQEIAPAQGELQEFLDALNAYSYEYKDEKHGEGRFVSPMAQEIESSKLGKPAISTNEEGYKQVNYGRLAGVQLAALAMLNEKFNVMEKQMKENITARVASKHSTNAGTNKVSKKRK